jgi:hydrogenase-4 component F
VTEPVSYLVLCVPGVPVVAGLAMLAARSARAQDWVNRVAAAVTAVAALAAAAVAVGWLGVSSEGRWIVLDALSGPFLAVIALVGLGSALMSPAYLRTSHRSFFGPKRARAYYYLCLYWFWAALLVVPIIGNLGVAWVLVEATTGVSALLVAYNGRKTALEAGWKYLVLTTAGLGVALLGIVVLHAATPASDSGFAGLSWKGLATAAPAMSRSTAVAGFLLVLAGLATKVGWAPVHNWLPDAHSEAPPPVSALLSAALLPTVMLVAWRTQRALIPVVGPDLGRNVFIGFGLVSLAVAVPFLWRPMAWKRLLAYSSLEHMGVLALGIGFGGPLAIAGVFVHVAGHAVAKSLGFYAAVPLFDLRPAARTHPVRGLLGDGAGVAAGMSVSLASLSGLPPSPLFFSEVLIIMGGFASGNRVSAAVASVLLALGFVGLAHVLVQDLLATGKGTERRDIAGAPAFKVATGAAVVLLIALAALSVFLPSTAFISSLVASLP